MADRKFTDLELERQLAGDLPADRAFDSQATDADRGRLAELRGEHEAFLRSVDIDNEVLRIQQRVARATPEKKVWWKWLVPMGAVVAAAAAFILVFVRRGDHPQKGDDDLQIKGDAVSLVVHQATESGSRRLASGDPIHAGDRIRFEVDALKPGYVAIVGIDGSGQVSVYYPASGNEPLAYDPHTRLLDGAIQLDATPGDERFFAIYATAPFTLDTVTQAMHANGPLPPGVSKAEVVLKKQI